jgi:hypothetical protein
MKKSNSFFVRSGLHVATGAAVGGGTCTWFLSGSARQTLMAIVSNFLIILIVWNLFLKRI